MSVDIDRTHANGSGGEGERSALELATVLLGRWKLLLGLPLLVGVSAVAFSFLLPEEFTAESRFVPEASRSPVSGMAGLAATFGVDLGAEGGESIDFYAELLESHDLLRSVVLTTFRFPVERGRDTLNGNLVELLDVEGRTELERVKATVDELSDLVVARPDPSANMITLSTSARWPALAVAINRRLLELLSEFNLERRQSRAASERQFLESRVAEAQGDLHQAEEALERFLSQNRLYEQSPQLTFEYGRLQRRVELQQQVYVSLAQAYEQARVDEVRNTPVITVIDQPRPPATQTAPNLLVNGLLGIVFGGLIAFGIVAASELLDSARRSNPAEYERLRRAFGPRRESAPAAAER